MITSSIINIPMLLHQSIDVSSKKRVRDEMNLELSINYIISDRAKSELIIFVGVYIGLLRF